MDFKRQINVCIIEAGGVVGATSQKVRRSFVVACQKLHLFNFWTIKILDEAGGVVGTAPESMGRHILWCVNDT